MLSPGPKSPARDSGTEASIFGQHHQPITYTSPVTFVSGAASVIPADVVDAAVAVRAGAVDGASVVVRGSIAGFAASSGTRPLLVMFLKLLSLHLVMPTTPMRMLAATTPTLLVLAVAHLLLWWGSGLMSSRQKRAVTKIS